MKHKLKFLVIRWKNLLSTGNAWNEIRLDTGQLVLINGKNGGGKTTFLDALIFCLFNKPFRNITKNQLVNSINQKNCVAEVEFEESGYHYKVVRGIKPTIFEIYKDGVLLNQESASRDYQQILETQILKMNMKTCIQMIILGSNLFVPFMQLPSAQRRDIIEDVLDIRIFSIMNDILKKHIQQTKEELSNVEVSISNIKTKTETQQKIISHLETSKQNEIDKYAKLIESDKIELTKISEHLKNTESNLIKLNDSIKDKPVLLDLQLKLTDESRKHKHDIDSIQRSIEFFTNTESCPSCKQGIPDEHSNSIRTDLESTKENIEAQFKSTFLKLQNIKAELDAIATIESDIRTESNQILSMTSTMKSIEHRINQNTSMLNQIMNSNHDIDKEKSIFDEYVKNGLELVNRKI